MVAERLEALADGHVECPGSYGRQVCTKCPRDIKLFIKDEPHKTSKLQDKRYRLISVLALEDQVVDRLLFQDLLAAQVKHPDTVKVGWAPLPAGFRVADAAFQGPVRNVDAKAFDWTLQAHDAEALLRAVLAYYKDLDDRLERIITNRFREVLGDRCVVRLPDGSRYRQTGYGLFKSGWLPTIFFNSLRQIGSYAVAMWLAFGLPLPEFWALGDDVLMAWIEGLDEGKLIEALRSLGQIVKRIGPERDFSGFRFGKTVDPLYTGKHKFILSHVEPAKFTEIVDAYALVYACSSRNDVSEFVKRNSTYAPPVIYAWANGLIQGL